MVRPQHDLNCGLAKLIYMPLHITMNLIPQFLNYELQCFIALKTRDKLRNIFATNLKTILSSKIVVDVFFLPTNMFDVKLSLLKRMDMLCVSDEIDP